MMRSISILFAVLTLATRSQAAFASTDESTEFRESRPNITLTILQPIRMVNIDDGAGYRAEFQSSEGTCIIYDMAADAADSVTIPSGTTIRMRPVYRATEASWEQVGELFSGTYVQLSCAGNHIHSYVGSDVFRAADGRAEDANGQTVSVFDETTVSSIRLFAVSCAFSL